MSPQNHSQADKRSQNLVSEGCKLPSSSDKDKFILDACCSGKQMWFNKNHPNVLYVDIRKEGKGLIKCRPNFEINPDLIADFRNFHQFKNKSFKHVVWDPPHIRQLGPNGIFARKYGLLDKQTWKKDLKKGFEECWRVLDDYGILIFKWSEYEIKLKDVLSLSLIKSHYMAIQQEVNLGLIGFVS